jgi:hypothetical protein
MTTDHLSDLTWDRLHAGDLEPELADLARLHAAGCARCAARGAALDEHRTRFQAELPPLEAAARPRWRAVVPLAVTAAAAAAVVAIALRPGPGPAERTKAGFAATAFAGRDGDAVPLGNGDPIFPGDRLQLSYSARHPGHLAVLAIDGTGAVAVYFPPGGATTWAAAAGQRIALPSSTELGDAIGAERLWVVFCDQPQQLAPLTAALAAGGAPDQSGCEIQRMWFDKRARVRR